MIISKCTEILVLCCITETTWGLPGLDLLKTTNKLIEKDQMVVTRGWG